MCGIIGLRLKKSQEKKVSERRRLVVKGIIAASNLQHRGQEGCGAVVYSSRQNLKRCTGKDLVDRVLPMKLEGKECVSALFQTRYSTQGNTRDPGNVQPFEFFWKYHSGFLVHNGNLVNVKELKKRYGLECPSYYSDSRIVALILSQTKASSFEEALLKVVRQLRGSFNLIALYNGNLYAVMDRFGFHPLQIGEDSESWIVASEDAAFDSLDYRFCRDVQPGEMVVVSDQDCQSQIWENALGLKADIFEYFYFSKHISTIFGIPVGPARTALGIKLGNKLSISHGIVCPLPESGNQAAQGVYEALSERNGIRYIPRAIYRRPGSVRSFLYRSRQTREAIIRRKFMPIGYELRGKVVILVDDTMIRGTTLRIVGEMLREVGVKEIHGAIPAPQYVSPCVYGTDTNKSKDRLVSFICSQNEQRIAETLGLDSITFLDLDEARKAILSVKTGRSPMTENSFYCGPFDGIYPDGTGDYAKAIKAYQS